MQDFKRFLLEALLADAWGGWRDLDRDFLEKMCERVDTIADSYFEVNGRTHKELIAAIKYDDTDIHEDCSNAETVDHLVSLKTKELEATIEDLEERERAALGGRVSILGTVRV